MRFATDRNEGLKDFATSTARRNLVIVVANVEWDQC